MTSTSAWEGELVRLRAVEASDWEAFRRFDADSEMERAVDVVHFPRSAEAARRWAADEASATPEGDARRLAVEALDVGGELVGSVSTFACSPRHGTFRYGVAVGAAHRRRGYAREAIALLLRHYFGELRYQKATVSVYAFNEASLRLHERLGFREEGRLRRMVFTAGAHHDEVVLGLLAEEFWGQEERAPSGATGPAAPAPGRRRPPSE